MVVSLDVLIVLVNLFLVHFAYCSSSRIFLWFSICQCCNISLDDDDDDDDVGDAVVVIAISVVAVNPGVVISLSVMVLCFCSVLAFQIYWLFGY